MKGKFFLLYVSVTIITIFGGGFAIRYFRDGDLYVDHLIAAIVGVIGVLVFFILKMKEKSNATEEM
ncbi:hypothetical protein [Alkalihalobacillus sp. CinArs1]|uniref:hypothetical protein n=1 Tax=Alkalihalobacillus sp. CinArs1 TaxID=2995314 RepID=UPI0022DD5E22|nr:hypothetical protein [Alkalihalobacillus sp. CinArs1]